MPGPASRATVRWLPLLLIAPLLAGCAGDAREPGGWAIATTHPLAAEAGAAVLTAGGNAFDAAAAIQFALNVVEPGMSGIGGGAFFVGYVAATKEFVVLDGRETAPAALRSDAFAEPDPYVVRHGTAVGVPGTVALWDEVLESLGTTSLADAMAAGRTLAIDGFDVDPYLAAYIRAEEGKLRSWPASAQIYFPGSVCAPTQAAFEETGMVTRCVGGTPLATGDRLVQSDLAAAYQAIMTGGTAAFYDGPIAQAIVEAVGQRSGVMTVDDVRGYEVVPREPTRIAWDGHEVVTFPAPGGGIVVAQALGILEPFDLAAMSPADRVHVLAETMRLVYADRGAYEADPAFVAQPEQGMLHPAYLDARRALIDMGKATRFAPGDPWKHQPGRADAADMDGSGDDQGDPRAGASSAHEGVHTTHFVVVDAQGNVASVTSTIESVFGSGIIVPGWGFFLNNEMTDFSTDPDAANAPAGGKRARSSMSPTIVLRDGEPLMAVGASGGPRIIVATLQVIINALELGMPLDIAVAAPRIYSPDHPVLWHEGLADQVAQDLAGRGHEVAAYPGHIANVQGALRTAHGWSAIADDRAALGSTGQGPATTI